MKSKRDLKSNGKQKRKIFTQLGKILPFPNKDKKPLQNNSKVRLNRNQTSDALNFSDANLRFKKMIKDQTVCLIKRRAAFLGLLMLNTGLRYSDAILVTHQNMLNGFYKFKIQKTGKNHKVKFNERVRTAYRLLIGNSKIRGYIFLNERGNLITNKYLNYRLKYMFTDYLSKGYNVSSQSLKKAFAVKLMSCERSEFIGLMKLQKAFGHENINNTVKYTSYEDVTGKKINEKVLFELKNH